MVRKKCLRLKRLKKGMKNDVKSQYKSKIKEKKKPEVGGKGDIR